MFIDSPVNVIQPESSSMPVVDVSMDLCKETSSLDDAPQIKRWSVHSMQQTLLNILDLFLNLYS